jgi:glycosyltransferase involved in cell wall biosynthesis
MCTFNRADYIAETIESILVQTYTNWELLIMDNGSIDNTHTIVTSFTDSRITYHKFDPTTTGRLRNIGFDKAKGEWLALMDSDDLWLPTKLEKQMNLLSANQNIFFSFTNSYDFKGNKEIVNILNPQTSGEGIENVFMPCMKNEIRPPIQTFLFHKKCLEVCGRFSETRIFNDYEFIGNLIYCFDAAIVHEPLLLRRLHNTNSIDVYSDELAEEYVDAILSFKAKRMLPVIIANDLVFVANINHGNIYFQNRKWANAIVDYWQAWKVKPFSIIPLKKITKTFVHYLKYL